MQRHELGVVDPVTLTVVVLTAVNFIVSNIDTDDDLIAMRDRVLNIFRKHGLNESIWNPYLQQFQLRHDDVKNIKLFNRAGYQNEWRRLYEMVFKIVGDHFPGSFNPFLEQTQNQVSMDVALDHALANPDITPADLVGNRAILVGVGLLVGAGVIWWMLSD